MKALRFPLAIATWLLLTTGCSGQYTTICEKAALCVNGGEKEIDACVEQMNADEEKSDIYECDEAWDTYVDCLEEAGACNGKKLGAGCTVQSDYWHACIDAKSGDRKARYELAGEG